MGSPTLLCVEVGSQAVVRKKSTVFIRPKQTKIWLCELKALFWSGMQGENVPYSRATQFNLSEILPGRDVTVQDGAMGIGKMGLVYFS